MDCGSIRMKCDICKNLIGFIEKKCCYESVVLANRKLLQKVKYHELLEKLRLHPYDRTDHEFERENERLREKNTELKERENLLRKEIQKLNQQIERLVERNEELWKRNEKVIIEFWEERTENSELKRKLEMVALQIKVSPDKTEGIDFKYISERYGGL